MRPQFRIWDKQENKYYEPTFEAYRGKLHDLTLTPSGELMMREPSGTTHESVFPDRYEVEMWTGLKDKNNVNIYEADILSFKANYSSNPCGWMKGMVVIGKYCIELHSENGFIYPAGEETDEFPYTSKVIGNIHQNPIKK